mmetsp:Transcript_88851/g.197429  ORF Transcript_88851/g.197429 Transcript_88851/m.197429 type:complete len:323 (+) Transcript_88851:197-1165(+)
MSVVLHGGHSVRDLLAHLGVLGTIHEGLTLLHALRVVDAVENAQRHLCDLPGLLIGSAFQQDLSELHKRITLPFGIASLVVDTGSSLRIVQCCNGVPLGDGHFYEHICGRTSNLDITNLSGDGCGLRCIVRHLAEVLACDLDGGHGDVAVSHLGLVPKTLVDLHGLADGARRAEGVTLHQVSIAHCGIDRRHREAVAERGEDAEGLLCCLDGCCGVPLGQVGLGEGIQGNGLTLLEAALLEHLQSILARVDGLLEEALLGVDRGHRVHGGSRALLKLELAGKALRLLHLAHGIVELAHEGKSLGGLDEAHGPALRIAGTRSH